MQSLLIYAPRPHPRLAYTFGVMFGHLLKINFQITGDRSAYLQASPPKINYGRQRLDPREWFIPAGDLLFESGVNNPEIRIFEWNSRPAFFHADLPETDLPFDLPAAVFYLLSRYEEYRPAARDRHDRFPASAGLASKRGFLQRPLINEWMIDLRRDLNKRFPGLNIPMPAYRFQPTFDIDLAWAYLHKQWYALAGGVIRSVLRGNFADLQARWRVLAGAAEDPFYIYPYLDQIHREDTPRPMFFFLLGNPGRYDRNISPQAPAFRELIRQTAARFEVGIHPSYRSNRSIRQLEREIKKLEEITGRPVTGSRQHFLRLRFPETYQHLLRAGIRADHTMGYASETGFRASVATPYPWYDLEKETETALMIHPFQVMDVTLKDYLRLEPEQALARIKPLIEKTKEVGGAFSTLWHNSSFSHIGNWSSWKAVYEELLRLARNE